jgi:1-acyl-sn-glycerol-3-phosphate acyltransferase
VIDLAEAWWHFEKCRFYYFFVYRAEILLASVLLSVLLASTHFSWWDLFYLY